MSRRGRLVPWLGGAAAAVLGLVVHACSSSPSGVTLACGADERQAGGGCIPTAFDAVSAEPVPSAALERDPSGTTYVRASLVVALKEPATPVADVRAKLAALGGRLTAELPLLGLYRAEFAAATTAEVLAAKAVEVAADPAVDFVDRDELLGQGAVEPRPKDSDLESIAPTGQYLDCFDASATPSWKPVGADTVWAYTRIKVPEAWDAIWRDNPELSPVVVGVVDEPVKKSPVFDALAMASYSDLTAFFPGLEPKAYESHGNLVGAVIGAPLDKLGSNGVLGGLRCIPYDLAAHGCMGRLPGDNGLANKVSQIAAFTAIASAVRGGARVVNMSFGTKWDDAAHATKVARYTKLYGLLFKAAPRVLFVGAAGNWGVSTATSVPAAAASVAPNAVAIAALGRDDKAASWPGYGASNVSPGVTLAAPGTDVLTARPDGVLVTCPGTSLAAPLVSGVAGLLFAIRPELTGAEARSLLVDSADPIADATVGGKRVNAAAAVEAVLKTVPAERKGKGSCRPPDPDPPKPGALGGAIFFGTAPAGDTSPYATGLYVFYPDEDQVDLLTSQAVDGVAVSPNGQRLAAGMLQHNTSSPRLTLWELSTAGAALKQSVSVLRATDTGPMQLTGPTWAADNQTLVVSNVGDLHLLDADTAKGSDKLYGGWFASFGPTGRALVVETSAGFDVVADARAGGYAGYDPMKVGSQGTTVLTPDPAKAWALVGSEAGGRKPRWSSANRLLYLKRGEASLFELTVSGDAKSASDRKVYAAGASPVGAAAWSPDGESIVYAVVAAEGSGGGLWVLERAAPDKTRRILSADLTNLWFIDVAWGKLTN